jgi:hypothetical protein
MSMTAKVGRARAGEQGRDYRVRTTFEKRSDLQKREKPYARSNRERRKQQPDRR